MLIHEPLLMTMQTMKPKSDRWVF